MHACTYILGLKNEEKGFSSSHVMVEQQDSFLRQVVKAWRERKSGGLKSGCLLLLLQHFEQVMKTVRFLYFDVLCVYLYVYACEREVGRGGGEKEKKRECVSERKRSRARQR